MRKRWTGGVRLREKSQGRGKEGRKEVKRVGRRGEESRRGKSTCICVQNNQILLTV